MIASDQRSRRLLIAFCVLMATYALIVVALRRAYWRTKRQTGLPDHSLALFQNPVLLVNPKAGNGRAIKAGIPSLAEHAGVDVRVMQKGDDVESLARQAAEDGADVLGISGGDGSIGAVAKVAIEKDLPMVVLPGGTRCHFARDIGLEPKRIADSLSGFHGVERRIDAAEINGRIFLNNASFGLYADIVSHPEYRDNKLRVSRQVLTSLADGTKPAYNLRFQHGHKQFHKAVQVLVGVNSYRMLSLTELGQRVSVDGGHLQVTVFGHLNNATVAKLLQAVSIDRLRSADPSALDQWESPTFHIRGPGRRLVVGVDGENETFDNPIKVRILPGALRIYVPAEGLRSRPKRLLSFFLVQQLWQILTAHMPRQATAG
jgi:diacylglycerol kinase family enzyme